jgi:hypothetical protein
MCAAGVVDATSYGTYLLILKIINIYLFGFWLILHYADISKIDMPFTKQKFLFFIFIFIFLLVEIVLEIVMFTSIDTNALVDCCGTLYSTTSTSILSKISSFGNSFVLMIFYTNLLSLIVFYYFKQKYIYTIVNFLFIVVSIISLILFFGTYIYELPTHHCPFCFLQKDYNYIGYLIYTLLFTGTFYGFSVAFIEDEKYLKRNYNISIIFNIFYALLVSYYPVAYYIKNGVFL